MSDRILVVVSTFPDLAVAESVAAKLVDERLAACVNIVPAMLSIYRWEGKVEKASEVMAVMKTTSDRYQALETRLAALHPYEVPEIIAVPVDSGLSSYLDWVKAETQGDSSPPDGL